jgi:hypothetical protein
MWLLTANDLARVDKLCRKYHDIAFVVLCYDLSAGAAAKGDPSLLLDLVRRLDADNRQGIILGPVNDDGDRFEMLRLRGFRIIDEKDIFISSDQAPPLLVEHISHMARAGTAASGRPAETVKKGLVEITIEDKNVGRCRTTLIIDSYPMHHADEIFHCDNRVFTDLLDYTSNLNSHAELNKFDGVLKNFRSVGRKTREMLLDAANVKMAINDLIQKVGSTEKVWFRFKVTRRTAPQIPFEAILRCDEQHDDAEAEFQLALSPVYRVTFASHLGKDLRPPLFTDSGPRRTPVNCLIINAATDGPPEPRPHITFPSLDPIDYAKEEAETVKEIIRRRYGNQPRLIDFADEEAKSDPMELLDRTFKETQWDLVHFIGHSYYKAPTEERREGAYVFLPSPRFPIPVPITQFAGWLTRSSFVYLSSCESAENGFIQALAAKPIPTIVGYRWKVSDYGAKAFAKKFYENLLDPVKPISIEEAFALAQRYLKDPDTSGGELPADWARMPIWAYPMLVMQNVG